MKSDLWDGGRVGSTGGGGHEKGTKSSRLFGVHSSIAAEGRVGENHRLGETSSDVDGVPAVLVLGAGHVQHVAAGLGEAAQVKVGELHRRHFLREFHRQKCPSRGHVLNVFQSRPCSLLTVTSPGSPGDRNIPPRPAPRLRDSDIMVASYLGFETLWVL